MHKHLLFISLFLFNLIAFSQDTTYIKPHPYNFNFKIYSSYLNQRVNLYEKNGEKSANTFIPNVKATLGASLNLKYVSIAYSLKLKGKLLEEEKYGATKYFTLNSESYFNKFGFEIGYQQYKGFYRPSNLILFQPTQIRSDVRFYQTTASLLFFTNNKKFSYAAAFSQSKKQLKSAGGIIITSVFNFKQFKGDSTLISSSYNDTTNYKRYKDIKAITYLPLELRIGYAYNFILKESKWFICPNLSGGLGATLYRYKTTEDVKTTPALHSNIIFKIATGYSSGPYFLSALFSYSQNLNYLRNNVFFAHQNCQFCVNAGVRFGSKKNKH